MRVGQEKQLFTICSTTGVRKKGSNSMQTQCEKNAYLKAFVHPEIFI